MPFEWLIFGKKARDLETGRFYHGQKNTYVKQISSGEKMNKKLEEILKRQWKHFACKVCLAFSEEAFAAGQADHEHNTVSCEGCSEIYHDGIYDGTETEDNASSRRAEGEASEEKQKGRQEVFDELNKVYLTYSKACCGTVIVISYREYDNLKGKFGVK